MKYVPPYGRESEGDAAHYINGNPVEGQRGSIPPAAAFEHPLREIVGVIEKSKFISDDADLLQLSKGVRSQRLNYAEDSGAANTLSVSYDPPISTYTLGLVLNVKVHTDNTAASTIDAGGGRVGVKTMAGFDTAAGDLRGGHIASLIFDGTYFQLINFFGQGGTGGPPTTNIVNIPYAQDVGIPNVIEATFSTLTSTDYTLKAGDPFLVRIKNTNSGASIARFHIGGAFPDLGDKPIRANGGGSANGTLQGDLQADDVVLFIFDGTYFWIQPNPVITADTTINVPSQYSSVPNALLAIRRKGIAQNAMVTILMAQGVYPPFTINHNNADRITVRGTMKIPGNLSGTMFAQTGSSPAARAADSANNIAMLRTRFGTEVQVPATTGFGIGNVGPGMPTVQDILITGPNYWSGDSIGRWNGTGLQDQRMMQMINVSCWGLDIGFVGGGTYRLQYCFSSGCFRNGALCTSVGVKSVTYSGFFGCNQGVTVNQNSGFYSFSCWANFNANAGAASWDDGQLTWHTSQAVGNGVVDVQAALHSYTIMLNVAAAGGVGTTSPAIGVLSADGSILING